MGLIQQNKQQNINIMSARQLNELDTICSSYIDLKNPKYIDIDGMYYSALIVIKYSREMDALFLNKVLSLDIDVNISIFYDKKNSYDVIKELTYNIGNAGATIKSTGENQQDIDILSNTYNDAKYIRKQLQTGEDELFYLTVYISTFANSLEDLEKNLQRIENVALGNGMLTIRANYRQEASLKAMLPFLNNDIEINDIAARNVLTSGLVATYPFVSNELYDKNGVLVGINSFDKSLMLLNRFDTKKYKNANMFVVGTSGSGKSYFIKLMINRNRFLNINQYIIDPDREYDKLCEKLGGTIIKFGSQQVINVFDIRETILEEGESFLRNKVSKLKIFFSLIFQNMSDEEIALLEEIIMECYLRKGITDNNDSLYEISKKSKVLNKKTFKTSDKMPVMKDLFELLYENKKMKKFATILKPYVSGSLKYLNDYTNIDLKNKLVVVDIHEVNEKEIPVVMFIITDFFWDVIKNNRKEQKILYLDEVWKMINKNENTAEFVFKLFKTIRKYGGAATAITQDINDFFMLDDGKYGKGVLNNASIKVFFQMEENDLNVLQNIINLSEEECTKLINSPRGTAIIHAGRNRLMVDVVSSEKEHELINTDSIENIN